MRVLGRGMRLRRVLRRRRVIVLLVMLRSTPMRLRGGFVVLRSLRMGLLRHLVFSLLSFEPESPGYSRQRTTAAFVQYR